MLPECALGEIDSYPAAGLRLRIDRGAYASLVSVRDWLTGNAAFQKRNYERSYTHPIVLSVLMGSFWGLFMWLTINRTFGGIVSSFVLGNLLFGPSTVWLMRCLHPRPNDGAE